MKNNSKYTWSDVIRYSDEELEAMLCDTKKDNLHLVRLNNKLFALVDTDKPEKTKVSDAIYSLFSLEEWNKLISNANRIKQEQIDKEKREKEKLRNRRGFGIIIINQFLGDWSNINSINNRPEFTGTKEFNGKVKGNWLIDEAGKRHKIDGNQVVKFKFYENEDDYKKVLKG